MQVQVLEKQTSTQTSSSEVFYSIFDPVDPNPDKSSLFNLVPKKFNVTSLGPVLLSTKLQKKAKKVGITISRHFFLFSTHLAYSSSDNPSKIKKYTELKGLKVNIGTTEGRTPDEKTKYTITLFRSKMQLKLYTHQQDVAEKWWENLKRFCIMTNFDDYYKRKDILGKGAHGKVVLAVNNKDEKNYAIKIFEKIQLITQLKGFESIINEIEILRKIEHKGIIRLHEVYESVSCVYLVLEYLEGGELYSRLKQRKMYTEQQCVDLMKNILEGLNFMHSKNIVHKDIKPENIVLVSENNESEVKLVDFGFATDLSVSNELKRCGTPGYVSPEVLSPNKDVPLTTKADIFALGAIFYQLLTGSKLFSGSTVEEILKKNKQCYINTTKLDARRISAAAKDLLFKMLERDPEQRISAAEILEHPFVTNTQVSTTEIPDDSLDSPVGQVTRYSFDMSYLKEQNICSHSKVCDSAGTFYITSHIPLDPQRQTWSRLHFDYERAPLPLHHLDASPKSIYSPGTSNATSESSFDGDEESKYEDKIPTSPKNTLSVSTNMMKTKKSWGSGTPTASPFHKAAILNNIKKSHLMELKPLEETLNGEEAPSGSFSDFLNKFSQQQKKHGHHDHRTHGQSQLGLGLAKRNSII